MSGKEESQPSIRTVAVIGAGTAGRSFTLACVSAGFHVVLEDVMPANLRRAQDDFSSTANAGAPHREEMSDERGRSAGALTTALTVEDAVRNADLVIDFVPDELESKLEIFSMLDRMAPPRTILLTPSNAQSITDLASCTYRARLCFALRDFAANRLGSSGTRSQQKSAHLVHPADFDLHALNATVDFLRALGCPVSVAPDPIAPMLIKNQPRG